MFRDLSIKVLRPVSLKSLKVDKSNMDMFIPIDNFDSQDFNLNDAGWIRNDISQIARAQSMDEYNKIAARMVDVQTSSNLLEGVTDEQAFDLIKPRYAQSANEIARFVEASHDTYMCHLNTTLEKFKNKETTEVDRPADVSASDGN